MKLCTKCHRALEANIWLAEKGQTVKLPRHQYLQLLMNFLKLGAVALILYILIF